MQSVEIETSQPHPSIVPSSETLRELRDRYPHAAVLIDTYCKFVAEDVSEWDINPREFVRKLYTKYTISPVPERVLAFAGRPSPDDALAEMGLIIGTGDLNKHGHSDEASSFLVINTPAVGKEHGQHEITFRARDHLSESGRKWGKIHGNLDHTSMSFMDSSELVPESGLILKNYSWLFRVLAFMAERTSELLKTDRDNSLAVPQTITCTGMTGVFIQLVGF